jgi:hypothetical protein
LAIDVTELFERFAKKAASPAASTLGLDPIRTPTRGIPVGCWATAAIGGTTAAPPSAARSLRRLIR